MACLIPKLLARDTFDDILDITPDLSDRIRSQRSACIGFSFEEAVSLLKTRQITQARVRRALLHLLLEIRTDETEYFRTKCAAPYAKVLGFRRTASPLLRAVKENGSIPLITKNTKARTILDARAMKMWEQDLSASHLYRGIRSNRYHLPFRTEYELSPVILP
jgi:predicted nucleotidyltransferase